MGKKLIIVESPAKAKTINKYLGDGYEVTSSYGHIRDLPSSGLAIDLANNYEPDYVVSEDKEKVIKELKKLAKKSSEIMLATDEDREGEAIAWHLCHVLDVDPKTAKRVTYTEITEKAVKKAVANPRLINFDLVNAQQARRVLDRLVGYELSPVLWKKVKPSLSAGRVQSVSVRIVVEREREIQSFKSSSSYKVQAIFEVKDNSGKVSLLKSESPERQTDLSSAKSFLESFFNAKFSVKGTEKKPSKRTPSAPFTTSTLQQEASRKLGFSVLKTMTVAQRLYEAGHITYMRTDSNSLSELALNAIKDEVIKKYGDKYHMFRKFATKNESAQEAHEAIRPTNFPNISVSDDRDEQRLYELIWKRTIASQMTDAELEKTIISISNDKNSKIFQALGEVVLFDGFLKVYTESNDEDEEIENDSEDVLLPPLNNGTHLPLREMSATERFARPAPRYTEASLVKKLEELGIGRPSTYAPTISTIQKRGYIVKETRDGVSRNYNLLVLANDKIVESVKSEITGAEKNKLFPTDIGGVVTDFLVENFPKILDYGFTAAVEKQFDEIAEGKKEWHKMIDDFYKPFHENIEFTTKEGKRASGERELGVHPESKEPIIARVGRYGPMVQIGKTDDETKKPRFAKLKPAQSIETITLDEALSLFKLPRVLGEFEGKEIKANIGRFGPYIQHNSMFVTIPKDKDPYDISLEESIDLVLSKRESDSNKFIMEFSHEDIQVLLGRYGAYIKKGKNNYKIPKGVEAKDLTLEAIKDIITETDKNPAKPKRSFKKK